MNTQRINLAKRAARLSVCMVFMSAGGCLDGSDADPAQDGAPDVDTDGDSDTDVDSETDTLPPWMDALEDCDFPPSDGCYPGDFIVDDTGDIAELADYPCVSGSLVFTGSELDSAVLPSITKACYLFVYEATALQTLSLPGLMRVEKDFGLQHLPVLSSFEAASLSEVGGFVGIYQLGGMTTFSGLPQLTRAGSVSIDSSGSVVVVELPNIEQIEEDLYVIYNGALEVFRAPMLQRVANLRVYMNDALTELSLPAMEIIEGNFEMDRDLVLKEIDLSVLQEVVGGVSISDLFELESFAGFASLETIGESISLLHDDALTSLDGLSQLKSVGRLGITDCSALTTLDGLSSLETVLGDVSLELNEALTEIGDLSSLASIGGGLLIHGSHHFADLDGLAGLNSLGGSIGLHDAELSDVTALHNLTTFEGEGAGISNCPHLPTCEVEALFDHFESIGWDGPEINIGNGIDECATATPDACGDVVYDGDVVIWDQSGLDALSGVTRIDGSLRFTGLDDVSDLSALSELRCVSGDVEVGDVPFLDLVGLESLWFVGGDMRISYNGLTSLEGLSSLSYTGGLLVNDQDGLTNLSGLASLVSIGDYGLGISYTSLQQLTGLESVTSIAGSIYLDLNCDLLLLSGLGDLEYFGGDQIWIADNADLAPGEAEDLVAQIEGLGWTGTVNIADATDGSECDE